MSNTGFVMTFKIHHEPENPELCKVNVSTINMKFEFIAIYFNKLEEIYQKESNDLRCVAIEQDDNFFSQYDDGQQSGVWDELRDIEIIYLRMHRYSAILAIYAYLESSMVKLCSQLERDFLPVKSSAKALMSSANVNNCRAYMVNHIRIDFTNVEAHWSKVESLYHIRNCIVHGAGDSNLVTRKKEGFTTTMEEEDGLYFIENDLIMVSADYILEAIENIRLLLIYLVEYKKGTKGPEGN
jgi:hypothetical protein